MNAPFTPPAILPILAEIGVGISELKKNPSAVIAAARNQQVAILNRNAPVAYMVSPEVWEHICDMFEDRRDAEIVEDRLANPTPRIKVEIADLV